MTSVHSLALILDLLQQVGNWYRLAGQGVDGRPQMSMAWADGQRISVEEATSCARRELGTP